MLGLGSVLLALVALLVGSVIVDTLLSRGRLDALTNTRIPNPNGPEIAAYVVQPNTRVLNRP